MSADPAAAAIGEALDEDPPWRYWLEPQTAASLRLLMLDDRRGNPRRPPLLQSLWMLVSRFLRFPAPMKMIYLFGGRRFGSAGREEHLDSAAAFDWWRGDWTPLPPMSSKRVGAAAAVLGRLIVVAGGYSDAGTVHPLSSVEAFDPARGRWLPFPRMPTQRYGLVLVSADGCLYAIGGDVGQRVCATNEVYDTRRGAWRQAAPMPRRLAGGKAEAYGCFVYYVGGCDEHESLSASIFSYCTVTDRWELALRGADAIVADADSGADASPHLRLRIGRTSFGMALLRRPAGTLSVGGGAACGSGDASAATRDLAHLVVTGGVSGRLEELFLSDTEVLPLAPIAEAEATAAAAAAPAAAVGRPSDDEASGTAAADLEDGGGHGWRQEALPRPSRMPTPRTGCRSVALWPTPRRPFLPWISEEEAGVRRRPGARSAASLLRSVNSATEEHARAGARASDVGGSGASPFVVVLGGEMPVPEEGLAMRPCHGAVALSLASGCWHGGGGEEEPPQAGTEAPRVACRHGLCAGGGDEEEQHRQFFEMVARLHTERIAFAVTLAPGLPRPAVDDVAAGGAAAAAGGIAAAGAGSEAAAGDDIAVGDASAAAAALGGKAAESSA